MLRLGKDLIFISRVLRDGSGVDTNIDPEYIKMMDNDKFKLNTLSLSEKTFIASEFNTFVVKLKPNNDEDSN